ncbi:hypothetical protein [endosymbiont GvMRE of Glomus versiforme]|nr:hypothetical protein [endosymbiont GvMRE of Glomus versiforme]
MPKKIVKKINIDCPGCTDKRHHYNWRKERCTDSEVKAPAKKKHSAY